VHNRQLGIIAAQDKRADRVLGAVIVELQMAVLEDGDQDRPLPERIGDRLPEQALGRRTPLGLIEPAADAPQDGTAVRVPLALAGLGIGRAQAPLHRIEFADECDHLLRGAGMASIGGLDDLPAHVRPAAGVIDDPLGVGEHVVGTVAIRLQVERLGLVGAGREQHPVRHLGGAAWGVLEPAHRFVERPAAEGPHERLLGIRAPRLAHDLHWGLVDLHHGSLGEQRLERGGHRRERGIQLDQQSRHGLAAQIDALARE
jgi:hypothetical protein